MCQNAPGTTSSFANGMNRRPPARIVPSTVALMSLKPVTPSGGANSKRFVPSRCTCVMSRPDTTTPPSACRARPPTPRRFGTTVSTAPVEPDHRWTPPPSTSVNHTLPSASTAVLRRVGSRRRTTSTFAFGDSGSCGHESTSRRGRGAGTRTSGRRAARASTRSSRPSRRSGRRARSRPSTCPRRARSCPRSSPRPRTRAR